MPDFCAAHGCSNSRSIQTRTRGITFHLFPKNKERRRQWEVALGRDGFVVSDRTLLCSEHFRSEDFDRTGQTVRLKDGVVPTVFSVPAHLQRLVASRSTTTSRRVEDHLPVDLSKNRPQSDVILPKQQVATGVSPNQAADHPYAMPACPKAVHPELQAASARGQKLQREKSNVLARPKRAKQNCIIYVIPEDWAQECT